ncbi:MAG TPA: hypothetical protein VGO90_02470 [Chthoniobacteraceae bacterium]|jgi:hypothetical protein|nr:hypothetical protein [Chthoniobacteraceae bacterium]
MELPDDVFPVRAPGVSFCVVRDAAGLDLIDGGFMAVDHFFSELCDDTGANVSRPAASSLRTVISTIS